MTTKDKKNSKQFFDTKTSGAIGIALIGGIGTIIAALITGLFGLLSTKAQVELPISATQTAQASLSLPYTTNTPQANKSLSASDVLLVEGAWSGCPLNHVLPNSIDPNKDIDVATEQFRALLTKEMKKDSMLPPVGESWTTPYYSFTLTGLSSNKEWVILDKKISIYIHKQDVPEILNIASVGGCGGELEMRDFPEFILDSQHEDYMIEQTFLDSTIAGFTLMPGEPELFRIPITCKTPGIYNIEIKMKIKYSQQEGEVTFSIPPVTCPKSYNRWDIHEFTIQDAKLHFAGNFVWDGSNHLLDWDGVHYVLP